MNNIALAVTVTIATMTITVPSHADENAQTNSSSSLSRGAEVSIFDIQGESHTSPLVGQTVQTTGVVTWVFGIGFNLQDPVGDGNPATSDAIFVFTNTLPTVANGEQVQVTGDVVEFTDGGPASGNLSLTLLDNPVILVLDPGPIAVPRVAIQPPPNLNFIDDDGLTVFDPDMDPLDYYESLETMQVIIANNFHVVGGRDFRGEIVGVVDYAGVTGANAQGGITLSETDLNPERVKLQIAPAITPGLDVPVSVGAKLENIVGYLTYLQGFFELIMTEAPVITSHNPAPAEPTTLANLDRDDHLFIASYNVFNLDPVLEDQALCNGPIDDDLGNGRFHVISDQIVNFLNTPDIIALQEIQDSNGCEDTGHTDASVTYQALINSIVGNGGPTYNYVDIAPVDGADGGFPGGNIRNGYLYNSARVTLDPASVQRIVDSTPGNGDAFENQRKPLMATFSFNGVDLTLINVHLRFKGSGGTSLFGTVQPAINGGEAIRADQAQEINDVVDNILLGDPDATVVVLGDLNEFPWNQPVFDNLLGSPAVLTNLTDTVAESDRYSFNFNGNSSLLDHVLVTGTTQRVQSWSYDIVNINTPYLEFLARASDHDPLLAAAFIPDTDADDDGLDDNLDNCIEAPNPNQADTNGDGIGNACDTDIAGPGGVGLDDCQTNFLDLNELKTAFFSNPQSPGWNPDGDFTQDGFINFPDLQIMAEEFFRNFIVDNPSGIANDCAE